MPKYFNLCILDLPVRWHRQAVRPRPAKPLSPVRFRVPPFFYCSLKEKGLLKDLPFLVITMSHLNDWSLHEKIFLSIDKLLFSLQDFYGPTFPSHHKESLALLENTHFSDAEENLGASFVKLLAKQIVETHSDGIITGIILLRSLLKSCLEILAQGKSKATIQTSLQTTTSLLLSTIQQSSWSLNDGSKSGDLLFTATQDPLVTKKITQALEWVGPHGNITLRVHNLPSHEYVTQGFKIEAGRQFPHVFHIPAHNTDTLPAPKILVTNQILSSLFPLFPCFQEIVHNQEKLVIFCKDITHDALATLTINKLQNLLDVTVISLDSVLPTTPSIFEDIALFTGTKIFSQESFLPYIKKPSYEELGTCASVELSEHETVLIQSYVTPEVLTLKIRQLEEQARITSCDKEKAEYIARKHRLQGSVAILPIPEESYATYHLALTTLNHAKRQGYVVGGGLSLLYAFQRCSAAIHAHDPDAHTILEQACHAPLSQLLHNTHIDAEVAIRKLLSIGKPTFGINVQTCQIEDFVSAGIIEPTMKIQNIFTYALEIAMKILMIPTPIQKNS